jgi:uncharacterized protein (DUF1697 family)
MPRYVAFLRGVSPSNAQMPALTRCFEQAGFTNVRTIMSSGNVAFDTRLTSEATIARKAEAAMRAELDRAFATIVRPTDALRALLATDPFVGQSLPAGAKRVVTFLGATATPRVTLPLSLDGATVLCVRNREAFTFYEQGPNGPAFMRLIEKAFGTDVTTRTWESVTRCAGA